MIKDINCHLDLTIYLNSSTANLTYLNFCTTLFDYLYSPEIWVTPMSIHLCHKVDIDVLIKAAKLKAAEQVLIGGIDKNFYRLMNQYSNWLAQGSPTTRIKS